PAAPVATVSPDDTGVAKFCGVCGAPRDAASTNFCRNCGAPYAGTDAKPHEASPAFAPKGGFWRRTGAYPVDAIILAIVGFVIGLLWVACDKNKQGWHDKMADTFVVRTA